jgi:hypothetical protein
MIWWGVSWGVPKSLDNFLFDGLAWFLKNSRRRHDNSYLLISLGVFG